MNIITIVELFITTNRNQLLKQHPHVNPTPLWIFMINLV